MRTIHVWPRRLKEFLLTHPLYKSPPSVQNLDAGRINRDRKDLPEGANVPESHALYALGQMRLKIEFAEACGIEPEKPFSDNPAIKSAFGRQVAHVAFRPGLDRIRNVLAEKTRAAVVQKLPED